MASIDTSKWIKGYTGYGAGPNCGACGYTGYGDKTTRCGWCDEGRIKNPESMAMLRLPGMPAIGPYPIIEGVE